MRTTTEAKNRRREIAFLYLEGKSAKEISEDSEVSLRTVQRDIKYVKEHMEEFLS